MSAVAVEVQDVGQVALEGGVAELPLVLSVGAGDDGADLRQVRIGAATDAHLVRPGAAMGNGHDGVLLL